MIEQLHVPSSPATMALFGFSAALAADQAHWPVREEPAYTVPSSISTISFFERSLASAVPQTLKFDREIAAIHAALSEGQEPLGAEFEAVWDANVASLYEA